MPDQLPSEKHVFATCALGWASAQTEYEALSRLFQDNLGKQEQEPQPVAVFEVPGPQASSYDINEYTPQVAGTRLMWRGMATRNGSKINISFLERFEREVNVTAQ